MIFDLSQESRKYLDARGILRATQDEYFEGISLGDVRLAFGEHLRSEGFIVKPSKSFGTRQVRTDLAYQKEKEGKETKNIYWNTQSKVLAGGNSLNFTIPCTNGDPLEDLLSDSFSDRQSSFIITEGIVKAVSIKQLGFNVVSLVGVNGWSEKSEIPNEPRSIKPVLLKFLSSAEIIYLAFDADFNVNVSVRNELILLDKALKTRGIEVKVIVWDKKKGKGIDDYLAKIENIEDRRKELSDLIDISCSIDDIVRDYSHSSKSIIEIPVNCSIEDIFVKYVRDNIPEVTVDTFSGATGKDFYRGYIWNEENKSFDVIADLSKYITEGYATTFLTRARKKTIDKKFQEVVQKESLFTSPNLSALKNTASLAICKILKNEKSGCLDSDPSKIRFKEKVYDMRENVIYEDRSYVSTSTSYEFPEFGTPTPNFDNFVDTTFSGMGQDLIIAFMRVMIDVVPDKELIVNLIGQSGSGKSNLHNTLAHLIPDIFVRSGNLDIDAKDLNSVGEQLHLTRLHVNGDCASDVIKNTELIYNVTSMSGVGYRLRYDREARKTFNRIRVLIVSINPMNITNKEGDKGGYERRRVVLKTNPLPGLERDTELKNKIVSEISGIAYKVFNMPFDRAWDLVKAYDKDMKPEDKRTPTYLEQFLATHVVKCPGRSNILPGTLLVIYNRYCKACGINPVGKELFFSCLGKVFDGRDPTTNRLLNSDFTTYELIALKDAKIRDIEYEYNPIPYIYSGGSCRIKEVALNDQGERVDLVEKSTLLAHLDKSLLKS